MTGRDQLTVSFATQNDLYKAYMPFLQGGGIFVRTSQCFPLGTLLSLHLGLWDEAEFFMDVKVVWVTPEGVPGNRPQGLGLQFTGENASSLCNRIEKSLSGVLKTEVTDTM